MLSHVVFFVDILGFESTIDGSNQSKIGPIAKLLHELARLRGPFKASEEEVEAGWQMIVKPAVSTFSDHVVISFRTQRLSERVKDIIIGTSLSYASRLLSSYAVEALKLGLLLRGGAALGRLHHERGVVLGKAMLEAYRLENQVAIYPRIAISQKLRSSVDRGFGGFFLLHDDDGVTHLNYFSSLIDLSQSGGIGKAEVMPWVVDILTENIRTLEDKERWKELAKWFWLRSTVERVRENMQASMLKGKNPPVSDT